MSHCVAGVTDPLVHNLLSAGFTDTCPSAWSVTSEAESKPLISAALDLRRSEYFSGKDEEHCPIGREIPRAGFGKLAEHRELG